MDKYEKEMFDFLTQEENLNGLIIAKNQFNTVSEVLAKSLWAKVSGNLEKHLENQKEWVVRSDKQITDPHSKIYLHDNQQKSQKDGLPSMFFGWERLTRSYPYYGFFLNKDSDQFKAEEIRKYLLEKKHEIANGMKGPDGGWLFWDQDSQIDFNIDKTLLNLIPAKVDSKALELSQMLIDLFEKMRPVYNQVKKDFIV
jgi:hypothetical protein